MRTSSLSTIRALMILDATYQAGLSPISAENLHLIAYFSNVLAPIWDVKPLDGKLLRMKSGPYYPLFQRELDQLVGRGVLRITDLHYVEDTEEKKWKLFGNYELLMGRAAAAIACINAWEDEREVRTFIQELAYAVAAFEDSELSFADESDATYSNPLIDYGNVIDFAEWAEANATVKAANLFQQYMPQDSKMASGEKLHFYLSHLQKNVRLRGVN